MRVIVLGGSGFIGRALIEALLREEYEPEIVSRRPGGVPEFSRPVRSLGWDELQARVDGAHAVINLAGENIGAGRWTEVRRRRIRSSRIDAVESVVRAVEAASDRPDVIIQGSAVGYYGHGPAMPNAPEVDELSPPGDGFLASVSRDWEAAAAPVETLGVRLVRVRTAMVLGRGGALEKFLPPFRFFVGGPLGSGQQWISWIHLEDEVGAILHLLRSDASGPFNLSAPGAVTMKDFCAALGRVMGRPSWLRAPSFALRLALGEMAEELVLRGQRVAPTALLETGFTFRYPEIESALKAVLQK